MPHRLPALPPPLAVVPRDVGLVRHRRMLTYSVRARVLRPRRPPLKMGSSPLDAHGSTRLQGRFDLRSIRRDGIRGRHAGSGLKRSLRSGRQQRDQPRQMRPKPSSGIHYGGLSYWTEFRTYFPFPIGTGYYDWVIHHPTSPSYFSYSVALNPFQVVVQPVALAQLRVLPYTLIYQPPGNASKATFATTTSYGISMAVDTKVANNQTTTVDNKGADTVGFGLTNFGLGDLIGKIGSIADSYSQATSWDKSTKTGVGTIRDVATSQATNYQSTSVPPAQQHELNSRRGGDLCWSAVLERHVRSTRTPAGRSSGNSEGYPSYHSWPRQARPRHRNSSSLRYSISMPAQGRSSPYANGIPVPGTTDSLSKDDCRQPLPTRSFLWRRSERALPCYQFPLRPCWRDGLWRGPANRPFHLNPTLSQVVAYSSTSTFSNIGSYTASVTDILGSTEIAEHRSEAVWHFWKRKD